VQGQARDWVYLYINDDVVELRDATPLVGKDTWQTQDALYAATGLAGHQLSVYSIGPAGEHLVRFAAIQGDYGHVASKNGVGAVMGKKKPRPSRSSGHEGLRADDARPPPGRRHRPRPPDQPRRALYSSDAPGVNLSKGRAPIKNYATTSPPTS
jgi:hypothetical protein